METRHEVRADVARSADSRGTTREGERRSASGASMTDITAHPNEASERPVGRRREDRIVGASRPTQQLIERVTSASRSDLPVLIIGPPGSGRQFAGRAIHAWSERANAPVVTVSCGAISPSLQMREIFGSAAQAVAAAPEAFDGALSTADAGTVILADMEELGADVRKAVVAAASQRSFMRVGESTAIPLQARLIATATEPGDLFGELPHHDIALTPITERREDVLPLAAHFLASFAEEAGLTPVGFTADARDYLVSEPWPGNVRELRERIRQAVRIAGNGAVSAEALLLAADGAEVPSFKEAKRAFETRYVEGLLRRCGGNISRAARLAKKDRKDFYDVIRRTGVDPSQFRQ